jgi:hypothetical protein
VTVESATELLIAEKLKELEIEGREDSAPAKVEGPTMVKS